MPTYEFTCPNGHDFDKFFRSMANAPTVVPCPVCGQPADRQVSGGAGLVFHGSGFYITDYGKDGKKDQKPAPRTSSASSSESSAPADSSPKSEAVAKTPESSGSSEPASSPKAAEAAAKASKTPTPPKAAE